MSLRGFRGFAEERVFDLSADIVVVHGSNGSGKTSLFDAILWALTGSVGRLGEDSDLVSRYSDLEEARVDLSLLTSDGGAVRIVRRFNERQFLLLDHDGESYMDAAAESELRDILAMGAESSRDNIGPFAHTVYLQQDQIRSFLDAESNQSRFEIVSEIVGAGRVGELVRQIEKDRSSWTRSTSRLREELAPYVERRDTLKGQISVLSADQAGTRNFEERWSAWFLKAVALSGSEVSSSGNRSAILESILDELRTAERRVRRSRSTLEQFSQHLEREPEGVVGVELESLELTVLQAVENLRVTTESFAGAKRIAADLRERQVLQEQSKQSLSTLARLAVGHLGERCPVCTQTYDEALTREHLRELMDASDSLEVVESDAVTAALADLENSEGHLSSSENDLRDARRVSRQYEEWKVETDRFRTDLGLESLGKVNELMPAMVLEAVALSEGISASRRGGEALQIEVIRQLEVDKLAEYKRRLDELEPEVSSRISEIERRVDTGEVAKRLHEALRTVSETLVKGELERTESLLQRIYASVDPHPTFRAVNFLTTTTRGRGHMWASIEDRTLPDRRIDNPSVVLSTSQMNVLAVAVFLSLNLSAASPSLQTILLDDPLQSLDDVNLLGLTDLLRRLRGHRQVLIATHDKRLTRLLERKLRPTKQGQRTTMILLEGWVRNGPMVSTHDVVMDSGELRLIVA